MCAQKITVLAQPKPIKAPHGMASLSNITTLLDLPEPLLPQIMDPSSRCSLRLTNKQLLAAVDGSLTRLSVAPDAHRSAAAAASRWPGVTELDLRTWSVPSGSHRAAAKARNAGLAHLRALLRAAEEHWPHLTAVRFPATAWLSPKVLEVVANCLRSRLAQLTLGHNWMASENASTAGRLAAHFPQLTSLHWGCNAVNDDLFQQIGWLTALRQLAFEHIRVEPKDICEWMDEQDDDLCASVLPLSRLVALTCLQLGDATQDSNFYNLQHVGEALSGLTGLLELNVQPRYYEEAAELLSAVAPLTRLTALTMSDSGIGSLWDGMFPLPDMQQLQHLRQLRMLDVPFASMLDADVRMLAQFEHLHSLSVSLMEVTAACKTAVLPTLTTLIVRDCDTCVVALSSLMPSLTQLLCTNECFAPLASISGHSKLEVVQLGTWPRGLPDSVKVCFASLPSLRRFYTCGAWHDAAPK